MFVIILTDCISRQHLPLQFYIWNGLTDNPCPHSVSSTLSSKSLMMVTVDVYLATGAVNKRGHRRSAPPSDYNRNDSHDFVTFICQNPDCYTRCASRRMYMHVDCTSPSGILPPAWHMSKSRQGWALKVTASHYLT